MYSNTLLKHKSLPVNLSFVLTRTRDCLVAVTLLLSAASVYGQESQRGPDVRIIAGEDKVIYEFLQSGELRMVRIVPKRGRPYYLVPRDPTKGFGNLERAEMLLPQWVIAEF